METWHSLRDCIDRHVVYCIYSRTPTVHCVISTGGCISLIAHRVVGAEEWFSGADTCNCLWPYKNIIINRFLYKRAYYSFHSSHAHMRAHTHAYTITHACSKWCPFCHRGHNKGKHVYCTAAIVRLLAASAYTEMPFGMSNAKPVAFATASF